ncbi:hypothetical protein KFL_006340100 [Klebsormidium nitens]|uniref:MASE1 domain-containing protein n=1 Tax=Klebsormidium nitens TaxID=105231 RepID=A0A1Y1IML8_KLENI|nr:hypothetical protein KFL_006340100 [Klebsormidium nitens]|eukprot:GAQ90391.1 hypothetical protein KFL_006340100 [Klebsormidium nitens]
MAQRWLAWRSWFGPPLITAAYLGVAQFGRLLVDSKTHSASVWPPSGVGLAAALHFGRPSAAVGIAAGSLLHLLLMYLTTERYHRTIFLAISPAFAAINVLEALVNCTLIQFVSKQRSGWFETWRGAVLFFLPIPFAPLASAYLIAFLLALVNFVPTAYVAKYATAMLVLATPALGNQEVTGAIFLAMAMVIVGTARGMGPFSGDNHSPIFWLTLEQIYICVTSAKTICIAALSREKDDKHVQLQRVNELLETRVQHRTSESTAAIDRAEEVGRQKLGFVRHVREEIRAPLVGIQRLCFTESPLDIDSLRARVAGTAELLVTVLDDLVDVGYGEGGRLCSEMLKFEPEALFRRALDLVRPDLSKVATLEADKDLPRYAEGDMKKLQRCLVAMINCCCTGDVCSVRLGILCMPPEMMANGVHSRHRLWIRFEVHAEPHGGQATDLEGGWVLNPYDPKTSVDDRPVVLADEMGGRLFRARDGLSARLEVPLRRTMDNNSLGSSVRFREARAQAILDGLELSPQKE